MFTKLLTAAAIMAAAAFAHCDSVKGPVAEAARRALASDDVNLVLPWVPANQESTIKQAFARTKAVRALGLDAERLADTWFFETVVRIHRAGEGAPYDGLKDTEAPAGIAAADAAIGNGEIEALASKITAAVAESLRQRYARVRQLKSYSPDKVNAGREYVAAYVDFIHFVEGLHAALKADDEHTH